MSNPSTLRCVTACLLALNVVSVTGMLAMTNLESFTGVQLVAFDDFILRGLSFYKDNMKDGLFNAPNYSDYITYPGNTANITTNLTVLQDLRMFSARVNSSIDLGNGVGTMKIDITLTQINITGSYHLEGVASSVIIVNGDGPYSIQSTSSRWEHVADLVINAARYVELTWGYPRQVSYARPRAIFEGILEEDVIGDIIQEYLANVGQHIFDNVQNAVRESFSTSLADYISNLLRTITIDDILDGNNTTPTTPTISSSSTTTTTTTMSPLPSSSTTMRPDLVVDVGADLIGSGWTIPTISECGYATNISGFFCQGSPVLIREPFDGTGFWMSPCPGKCSFHYDNLLNGKNFRTLGIRAYYNDNTAEGSRITVDFEHTNGTIHREFVRSDGDYHHIDFAQFGTLLNINVTMENGGQGHFAVMDRLTAVSA